VGSEAVRVYADGQRMLKRLIEGRWLTANAVMGFWPANTVNDDDIELYTMNPQPGGDDLVRPAPARPRSRRSRAPCGQPLPGDFIARRAWPPTTSACSRNHRHRQREKGKVFLDDHDDYSAITLKALADRWRGLCELLHERVRKDLWATPRRKRCRWKA